MISKKELSKLLLDMEEDRIEKTISKTDTNKFGEAICSFSNDMAAKGLPGYLIVGANDDGSIAGIEINEQIIQMLLDFRTDGRIVPPPTMIVEKFSFDQLGLKGKFVLGLGRGKEQLMKRRKEY